MPPRPMAIRVVATTKFLDVGIRGSTSARWIVADLRLQRTRTRDRTTTPATAPVCSPRWDIWIARGNKSEAARKACMSRAAFYERLDTIARILDVGYDFWRGMHDTPRCSDGGRGGVPDGPSGHDDPVINTVEQTLPPPSTVNSTVARTSLGAVALSADVVT